MKQQGICILGSTGTIGVNTLDVIRRHPKSFRIIALTANRQVERMHQQCQEWQPEYVVMSDPEAAAALREIIIKEGLATEVFSSVDKLSEVVQ